MFVILAIRSVIKFIIALIILALSWLAKIPFYIYYIGWNLVGRARKAKELSLKQSPVDNPVAIIEDFSLAVIHVL